MARYLLCLAGSMALGLGLAAGMVNLALGQVR